MDILYRYHRHLRCGAAVVLCLYFNEGMASNELPSCSIFCIWRCWQFWLFRWVSTCKRSWTAGRPSSPCPRPPVKKESTSCCISTRTSR